MLSNTAFDPDYTDADPRKPLASKVEHQYRGFVRVRLRDLVNGFFVVRGYHEREKSMEELWRQIRKEGDGMVCANDQLISAQMHEYTRRAMPLATSVR